MPCARFSLAAEGYRLMRLDWKDRARETFVRKAVFPLWGFHLVAELPRVSTSMAPRSCRSSRIDLPRLRETSINKMLRGAAIKHCHKGLSPRRQRKRGRGGGGALAEPEGIRNGS